MCKRAPILLALGTSLILCHSLSARTHYQQCPLSTPLSIYTDMLCHNSDTKPEQRREGCAQRARFVFSCHICENHATRFPVYEVKCSKCACAAQCQPRWVAGQGCQFSLKYEKKNATAPRCEKFVNQYALHSCRVRLFPRLEAGWITRAAF